MRIQVIVAVVGVTILCILVPLAIIQRRRTAHAERPSSAPTDAFSAPPSGSPAPHAPRHRSLNAADIALGVFLGMWAFTLSGAIVGFAILQAVDRHWHGL